MNTADFRHQPLFTWRSASRATFHPRHIYEPALILIVCSLLFAGVLQNLRSRLDPPPSVLGLANITPEPTITLEPTITPTPTPALSPTPVHTVYRLSVRPQAGFAKPATRFTGTVNTFLMDHLSYDTTAGTPFAHAAADLYNFDYYFIHLSPVPLPQVPRVIDNALYAVSAADEALKPYLLDNRFCRVDSDCVLRNSYCTYGAFNRYEPLIDTWICPRHESQLPCKTPVQYESATCAANRCAGVKPTFSCQ